MFENIKKWLGITEATPEQPNEEKPNEEKPKSDIIYFALDKSKKEDSESDVIYLAPRAYQLVISYRKWIENYKATLKAHENEIELLKKKNAELKNDKANSEQKITLLGKTREMLKKSIQTESEMQAEMLKAELEKEKRKSIELNLKLKQERRTTIRLKEKNNIMKQRVDAIEDLQINETRTVHIYDRLLQFEALVNKKLGTTTPIEVLASQYSTFAEQLNEKERVLDRLESELHYTSKIIDRKQSRLEEEKQALEECEVALEALYPHRGWFNFDDEGHIKKAKSLNKLCRELNRIYEEHDMQKLLEEEFLYAQKRQELLLANEQLKKDRQLFAREKSNLINERNKLYEYNIEVQRQLCEEIEENGHLLFVVRSFKKISPLYAQIVSRIVKQLKTPKQQRIVSRYLAGDSVREIARDEQAEPDAILAVMNGAVASLKKGAL